VRVLSWIIVAGSLAWLMYGQLRIHFTEQELSNIHPSAVRGTVEPAAPLAGRNTASHHVIAYAELYPLLAKATSATHEPVSVPARVQSTLEGVQPIEIRLTLRDGDQMHRFPVNRFGEVRLPLRADWRDAGRQIVSNQPKGTLTVRVARDDALVNIWEPGRHVLAMGVAHQEP
jgi:hypothetical protein